MAVLTQEQLKALFETGDIPSQQDFIDLIDTLESNSAVVSATVAGTGDVWDDVNSTVSIVQTSKQINVIKHNGIYYMFNGGIGTFGISGTATTSANFIQISDQLVQGAIDVQEVEVLNEVQLSDMSVTNLVNKINTSETFTHSTSQSTVIKYSSAFSNRVDIWYLFDGAEDTYGVGGTAVGNSNFIEISRTNPSTTTKVLTYSVTGTGNVWDDVNANTQVFATPGYIALVIHNNNTYLLNPSLDAYGNPQIYGQGFVVSTSNEFVLVGERYLKDKLENIVVADFGNYTTQDFDFSLGENFYIAITDTSGIPAGQTTMTASNLVDGQSGYIRIERAESTGMGDQYNWLEPFIDMAQADPIVFTDSVYYYLYEIVGDRILLYSQNSWDRPFP